jgi:hypothetical protein
MPGCLLKGKVQKPAEHLTEYPRGVVGALHARPVGLSLSSRAHIFLKGHLLGR